jgi:hypothetical protein
LTNSRFFATITSGLVLAALTVFGGFVLLGMGHGPDAPLKFSWLTFALYPLAFLRFSATAQTYGWARDFLTSLGALLLVIFGVSAIPEPLAPQVWYIYIFGLWPLAAGIALFGGLQYLAARFGKSLLVGDIAMILIAVALDMAFWQAFANDMFGPRTGGLFYIWLVAWLGWQLIALAAFYRHISGQSGGT